MNELAAQTRGDTACAAAVFRCLTLHLRRRSCRSIVLSFNPFHVASHFFVVLLLDTLSVPVDDAVKKG